MVGKQRRFRVSLCLLVFCTLIAGVTLQVKGQYSLNGETPSGLAPGAPAGSYSLGGFESVNAYNGGLNFDLPLVSVGGRGSIGTSVNLAIQQKWTVSRYQDPVTLDITNTPEYPWWTETPKYVGARVVARTGGNTTMTCTSILLGDRPVYPKALTRITVSLADGTEIELRDTLTGGEPKNVTRNYPQNCPTAWQDRGKIFVTADGTSATFVSDYNIADEPFADESPTYPYGILLMKDGSRWRFDAGILTWMEDRNGNRISFSYTYGSSPTTTITDSLRRNVVVTRDVTDGTYGLCDKITYKGFGGASRTIYITKTTLSNVLRSGYTLKTLDQLFPSLDGTGWNNPTVKSAVYLPNGKSYQFKYNSFGELARVVLPTGGAIEYDWGAGDYSTESIGGVLPTTKYLDFGIYRRIIERRVYADGSTLEHKEIYERPAELTGASSVVIESLDAADNLLSKSKTYFWGSAKASFLQQPLDYGKWRDGRAYQVETYDFDGSTVLRKTENTYAQRTAASPFNWWTGSADDAPPYDPRLTETKLTLSDSGQVSKQTFSYDDYNNRTDAYEYDYGSGTPGAFVRRTHTGYVTSVGSTNYANPAPTPGASPTPAQGTIHIRDLPSETWVSSDSSGSTKLSKTTFEYDNYATDSNHAGLVNRSSISGHDSLFSTSYTTRGNATAVTRWLNLSGTPTGITSYQQYDIAGNVVKVKDARGYETTASYADSFGYPNANATTNSSPTELSSLSLTSYAFATSVTNALSQTVYSQFDYYTGMPVDAQDVNGIVTSGESAGDALDRPTQVIRAAGQSVKSQTTFAYDDTSRKVTTTSDLASYNDNALKTESFYDGLGRTTETRRYEGASTYIKQTQTYDALGRIKRAYNPFRTTSDATYGYAESTYDALGRVTTVATSDGSQVTSSYYGNATTVTDQAAKTRRSITDALGRLSEVDEPDASGNLGSIGSANQPTTYNYDVLNNLLNVYQGSQTRTFVYDNLSRLTTATNPESGTIDYTYDANSNLSTKLDDRSITTSYTYDALNRVTNRNYDDATPDVTYTYDNITNAIGRLTKVSNSNSETYYTAFDKMGRVTAHKQRMNSVDYTTAYTYNLAGALLEETYPSGRVVKNTIGSYGDLTQVETKPLGGSYTTRASNFVYSAPGAVSSMQLGNSKYETTEFNSRLQPVQIGLGTSTSDTSLLKIEYGYGTSTTNNGNVTTQKITVPGVTYAFEQAYTYDNLNRIATATESYNGSQTWTQTFGYDRYGNRNITAGTGATSLTFSSSTNRITTSGYTFDAVGNTTADPSGKTFAYDAENKQTSVSNGTTLGNYSYDGDGKRVKKFNTSTGDDRIFLYDVGGRLVEERDLSNTFQINYVYSRSRLLSTETTGNAPQYLTADMLGTPRINTDGSGNVTARHDYLPFGEKITSALTPQRTSGVGYVGDGMRKQFTGYDRDNETGNDYAKARTYGSLSGRFTSPDPSLVSSDRQLPQSWNRYTYVLNNPLNLVDPSGLRWGYFDDQRGRHFCWASGKAVCKGYSEYHGPSILDNTNYGTVRLNSDGTFTRIDAPKSHIYPRGKQAAHNAEIGMNISGGALCSLTGGILCLGDPNAKETQNVKAAVDIAQLVFLVKSLAKLGISAATIAAIVKSDPKDVVKIATTVTGKFGVLECVQCANALEDAFKLKGVSGEVLELKSSTDFIISDALGGAKITENGIHQGVKVGDMVFDNIHKSGMPYAEWLNDFHSPTGFTIESIRRF